MPTLLHDHVRCSHVLTKDPCDHEAALAVCSKIAFLIERNCCISASASKLFCEMEQQRVCLTTKCCTDHCGAKLRPALCILYVCNMPHARQLRSAKVSFVMCVVYVMCHNPGNHFHSLMGWTNNLYCPIKSTATLQDYSSMFQRRLSLLFSSRFR